MKIANFRLKDKALAGRADTAGQAISSCASFKLARHSRLMSLAGAIDEEAADKLLNNIRQSRRNKGWNLAE